MCRSMVRDERKTHLFSDVINSEEAQTIIAEILCNNNMTQSTKQSDEH